MFPPHAKTGHNAEFLCASLVLVTLKAGQAIVGIGVGIAVGAGVGGGKLIVTTNVPLHDPLPEQPCPILYFWHGALVLTTNLEHKDDDPQPLSFWAITEPNCPIS